MKPIAARSLLPLTSLLAAGVFVLACSSDDTGSSSPIRHYGGGTASTPTSGSTPASGGSTTTSTGNGETSTGSSSGGTTTTPPGASGSGSSSGGSSSGSSSSGSSSGATTPPAPTTPAFTVTVDNAAPSINLADTTVLNVTITPQSWSGAVTLSAANLPSDITGAFDNATVNVTGTTPATAKLTLTSIDATAPNATPFKIMGTVGEVVQNVPATVTVKSYITLNLPVNADSVTDSFGTVHITAPADIATNPVIVNFVNLDSTPHEIHAEGPAGFDHGKGTFNQNQADTPVRKVTASGTYAWHLHDDAPPSGPPGGVVIIGP